MRTDKLLKSYKNENVYSGKISIHKNDMDQTNLLKNMVKFSNKSRPKTKEGKDKKENQ